jgi:prepilin-type processing-associated H-X9-DG protein
VVNCNNDHNFYSFHTGGANFLMCDGSVRFVRDSVEAGVVVDMLTRAYGETTNTP